MAKNILAQLCSRTSHLKPFPSGAGQKGKNSLGMAHLERVGSFLIIENKKSSHGNVYKLKCDSVTLVISPACLVTLGSGCGAPQWCQHVVAVSGCMHMWESGCHRSFQFSLLSASFKCQSFVWCYNGFSLYKWILVLGTCGILVCCIFLYCAADLSCKIPGFPHYSARGTTRFM